MAPTSDARAGRLAILATLLALAGSPDVGAVTMRSDTTTTETVKQAATELYGARAYTIGPATDDAFEAVFLGIELYVLREPLTTWSQHKVMAFRPVDQGAWDTTRDFNRLLRETGTLIPTEADAIRIGRAYAQVANPELRLGKTSLVAADAVWLQRDVPNPSATPRLDGWQVELQTWSEENGILAAWTINTTFSGISSAEWQVLAVGLGPARRDEHALFLPLDLQVVNDYSAGHLVTLNRGAEVWHGPETISKMTFTPTAQRVAADGAKWQVYFPAGHAQPPDLGDISVALAEAGVFAYDRQVARNTAAECGGASGSARTWGFESRDGDCVLEIFVIPPNVLACLACPLAGTEVRILVSATFVQELQGRLGGPRLYTNPAKHDLAGIARVVMGHEHMHNLQYALNGWAFRDPLFVSSWDAAYEGQARLSEVLLDPDTSHDASSAWFFDMDLRHSHPQYDLCGSSYEAGLYWGRVYAHHGGLETLRAALREMPNATGRCWSALPSTMDRALPAGVTHAQVLSDFAVADRLGEHTWGDPLLDERRAWGPPILRPVAQVPLTLGSVLTDVHASGVRYLESPSDAPFIVKCVVETPADEPLAATLLRLDESGALLERVPVPCGASVAIPATPQAVLEVRAVKSASARFRVETLMSPG